jgi:hypothetical protein
MRMTMSVPSLWMETDDLVWIAARFVGVFDKVDQRLLHLGAVDVAVQRRRFFDAER